MNRPKILIVDDDMHLRQTLKDILAAEGYDVYEAESGAEAQKASVSSFFEIILMDYNLTDKTGIEVIKSIRSFNTESQIIMITAYASIDTAVKAIQESVYDFLIKPIDFNHLKRVIKKALDKFYLEQSVKNLVTELKDKNQKLTVLNEMKSKFMSMASHDLANTLMALQLSFDMLSDSLKPDEEQKEKVFFIKKSMEQIANLINDLVDWAAIEKGKFQLKKNHFAVDELLKEVVDGVKGKTTAKNISLTFKAHIENVVVNADKKRIMQVVLNILENAVRYTPKNGQISVFLKTVEENDEAVVSIKDSGVGIEPDKADKLFESFYQEKTKNLQSGRLGLGLSIAREIITSHNGHIWVESEGLNKGAEFKFSLPLSLSA